MASATSDPFADPLRHHEDVVDAASHGGVNSSTELAVMARLGSRPAEMRYLKSLTGIADCAVLCRIRLEDGSTFPATLDARECGYRLYLTYNKIVSSLLEMYGTATYTHIDDFPTRAPRMPLRGSSLAASQGLRHHLSGVSFLLD